MPQGIAEREWSSLLGDKYRSALPFSWELTEDPEKAQVFVWEGTVTKKSAPTYKKILELLKQGERVLLLHPSAWTLFKDEPKVIPVDLEQIRYVEIPGGNVLPEDLLWGLSECFKKLQHV